MECVTTREMRHIGKFRTNSVLAFPCRVSRAFPWHMSAVWFWYVGEFLVLGDGFLLYIQPSFVKFIVLWNQIRYWLEVASRHVIFLSPYVHFFFVFMKRENDCIVWSVHKRGACAGSHRGWPVYSPICSNKRQLCSNVNLRQPNRWWIYIHIYCRLVHRKKARDIKLFWTSPNDAAYERTEKHIACI